MRHLLIFTTFCLMLGIGWGCSTQDEMVFRPTDNQTYDTNLTTLFAPITPEPKAFHLNNGLTLVVRESSAVGNGENFEALATTSAVMAAPPSGSTLILTVPCRGKANVSFRPSSTGVVTRSDTLFLPGLPDIRQLTVTIASPGRTLSVTITYADNDNSGSLTCQDTLLGIS